MRHTQHAGACTNTMKVFNINIYLAFQDESDLRLTTTFLWVYLCTETIKTKRKKEQLLLLLSQLKSFVLNQNHIAPGPLKAWAKMTISLFKKRKKTYHESVTGSSKWIIYLHFCKAWVTTHSKTGQVSAVNLIRSK